MIALPSSYKPESLTLVKLSKLVASKLNNLDIHGECYLYWTGEWLRIGWIPTDWDEYAVVTTIPCDILDEDLHEAFVEIVSVFVRFHGGKESDSSSK